MVVSGFDLFGSNPLIADQMVRIGLYQANPINYRPFYDTTEYVYNDSEIYDKQYNLIKSGVSAINRNGYLDSGEFVNLELPAYSEPVADVVIYDELWVEKRRFSYNKGYLGTSYTAGDVLMDEDYIYVREFAGGNLHNILKFNRRTGSLIIKKPIIFKTPVPRRMSFSEYNGVKCIVFLQGNRVFLFSATNLTEVIPPIRVNSDWVNTGSDIYLVDGIFYLTLMGSGSGFNGGTRIIDENANSIVVKTSTVLKGFVGNNGYIYTEGKLTRFNKTNLLNIGKPYYTALSSANECYVMKNNLTDNPLIQLEETYFNNIIDLGASV